MADVSKNASRASCIVGYRVYRRARDLSHPITRESLNVVLTKAGYDAVSQRTWDNYVEQYDAGITPDNYKSINVWDYFHRAGGPRYVDRSRPDTPSSEVPAA